MRRPESLWRWGVSAIGVAYATAVLGNGINPPRLADSRLEASCTGWDGLTRVFTRAHIDSAHGDQLTIKRADGSARVPIAKVVTLTFPKRASTRSVEAVALLSFRDGNVDEKTWITLVADGKPLRLTGFAGTTTEGVLLSACRKIVFEFAGEACPTVASASAPDSVVTSGEDRVGRPSRPPACPPSIKPQVERLSK